MFQRSNSFLGALDLGCSSRMRREEEEGGWNLVQERGRKEGREGEGVTRVLQRRRGLQQPSTVVSKEAVTQQPVNSTSPRQPSQTMDEFLESLDSPEDILTSSPVFGLPEDTYTEPISETYARLCEKKRLEQRRRVPAPPPPSQSPPSPPPRPPPYCADCSSCMRCRCVTTL